MHPLVGFLLARLAEDRAALLIVDRQFPGSDRWVADCDAKRAIVELIAPGVEGVDGLAGCDVLIRMAQPYGDHPDFREAWRR